MRTPGGSGESSRRNDPVKRGQIIFANVRNRHRVMAAGAILAVLTAVAVSFAVNAKADDPDVRWDDYNGRVSDTYTHPDNAACGAKIRVDLHRGYPATDADATYRSGVVAVTKVGAATLRIQIDYIRVGAVDGNPVSTDNRPSKLYDARNNGLSPADALNSDSDYPGNVNNITGYSDALLNRDADTDPSDGVTPEDFRVRASVSVRCTDGRLFTVLPLSNPASNDA